MFGHDATGGFFENYEAVGSKNPEGPDSYLYSNLDQLEDFRNSKGKFQFKLCYPELTWGKDGVLVTDAQMDRQETNKWTLVVVESKQSPKYL